MTVDRTCKTEARRQQLSISYLRQSLLPSYLLSEQAVRDAAESEVPGHEVHEAAQAAVVAHRLSVEAKLHARDEVRHTAAADVIETAAERSLTHNTPHR